MSWRDKIAKSLLERFGGLTTDAYHGTKRQFEGRAFKEQRYEDAYSIDRALGPHFAKDPALSGSFANPSSRLAPGDYNRHLTAEAYDNIAEIPQVLPVKIPDESAFLQAVQPIRYGDEGPIWQRVKTDTKAIEDMAAEAAYLRDPDLLTRYLERGRAMRPPEARAISRALVQGEQPVIEGKPRSLAGLVDNYSPASYDAARITDLARDSWQDKGYAGIRYINTAPEEAGARGVKDVTSYIVFNPADIRSRFAQFDPARWMDKDLLAGIGGAAVVTPPVIGELVAPDRYEAAQ
jgi:hypothetical protein